MRNYSYAGPSRGQDNPEDIRVADVDEECGDVEHRRDHDPTCLVIIWSGNEYSSHRSWISADKDSRVNLEDVE